MSFTQITDPKAAGGFTDTTAVNNGGTVVGYYAAGERVAFIEANGTYIDFDAGFIYAINNGGTIAGDVGENGFVATPGVGGTYILQTIAASGALSTSVAAINDSGEIVGSYFPAGKPETFFIGTPGTAGYSLTPVAGPNGVPIGTLTGVNDAGDIIGNYAAGSIDAAFVAIPNGSGGFSYGTLALPGASETDLDGINNEGTAVGQALVDDPQVGYEYEYFTYNVTTQVVTVLDNLPPDTDGLTGINDAGSILGVYVDSDNVGSGFLTEPACFCSGTRIRTARGEVPVEALRVGDLVVTASGDYRPVIWIGQRRINCGRYPNPKHVHPVRIRAHAVEHGWPACDLRLSPDHAVFHAGVLIPIRVLVNGSSVVQEAANAVTYWHVELDQHDVLLAEGLPVESFLDTGGKAAFVGGNVVTLTPDFAARVWEAEGCAPIRLMGREVDAVREHLARRLDARRAAAC
jgi:hypothetical protein